MRKDKKLGLLSDCDGGTLTEAYCLLAEVYQLLNEYAPVWYSADLCDRLQAALRAPERNTLLRLVENNPVEPINSRNFAPPQA